MKTVVIAGMLEAWTGPTDDVEVWGCNLMVRRGDKLDRVFLLHEPEEFLEPGDDLANYIQKANALDVPVYMRLPDPRIPRSVAYPIREVLEYFGICFFTSTIAWQMAMAIMEGFEKIILHRIFAMPANPEYFTQKSCLDYWMGQAQGRGIMVVRSSDSYVGKAHPWQSPLYGYVAKRDDDSMSKLLGEAVKMGKRIPVKFERVSGSELADGVKLHNNNVYEVEPVSVEVVTVTARNVKVG